MFNQFLQDSSNMLDMFLQSFLIDHDIIQVDLTVLTDIFSEDIVHEALEHSWRID